MNITTEQPTKQKKEKKLAGGRGKETFFRVSSRNQINLIAIADNKANIITGINAILISLIVAFLGSGMTLDGAPIINNFKFLAPFTVLLVFSLVSCILAILAAKPVFISNFHHSEKQNSLILFDDKFDYTLPQYQSQIKEVLRSNDEIYDQLMIEMYNNGLILKRKWGFLKAAYLLFMIGFIFCAILSFLIFLI